MKIKGVGYGSMMYGVGYGFARPDFGAADVEISADGSISIWNGGSELGQGLATILCQFASQELGIAYERMRIFNADTSLTPNSGPVSASRSTFVQGSAVVNACQGLRSAIIAMASVLMKVPTEDLMILDEHVVDVKHSEESLPIKDVAGQMHKRGVQTRFSGWYSNMTRDVDPETSQGDAFRQFAWATQAAEVEVDTDTGMVKVLSIASATDAGKAINPLLVEGQIEGGALQGLGYALMEDMKVVRGEFLNASLSNYLIPTAADAPRIIPLIVEVPDPSGPMGAKGVGEPALIPTAPAILNAINAAVGKRIVSLPASPERVLTVLGKIPTINRGDPITIDMVPYPSV